MTGSDSFNAPTTLRAAALLIGCAAMVAPAAAGDAWTDLGGPLAGVSGDPLLVGAGTLKASTIASLTLSNAAPSSVAALFVSFDSNPAPFKGGVLQTLPLSLTVPVLTNGAGELSISFPTPLGLPAGFQFYVQSGIQDAAAILGVALSNAVQATVPEPAPFVESFLPISGGPGVPITLDGVGFSDDPAEVAVLVGGLLLTPVSGSTTTFTGTLPPVPDADIGPEPIQVFTGEGEMILSGGGDGDGYQLPAIPGITSVGSGFLWNNFNGSETVTTIDEFDKTNVPDSGGAFFINEYLPTTLFQNNEICLPLGSAAWTANTSVDLNFFIVLADGRLVAFSLNTVKLSVTSQVACASALATLINDLLDAQGLGLDLFALPVSDGAGGFLVKIFAGPTIVISGVCGSWAISR